MRLQIPKKILQRTSTPVSDIPEEILTMLEEARTTPAPKSNQQGIEKHPFSKLPTGKIP